MPRLFKLVSLSGAVIADSRLTAMTDLCSLKKYAGGGAFAPPPLSADYFSMARQNRWSIAAASARLAAPVGTSLPSLPLITPFMVIQYMSS